MSTDLYGIRVLETSPAECRVRLRIFVVCYDTAHKSHEPLPGDHSFFLGVLQDKVNTRSGGKRSVAEELDTDNIPGENPVETHTRRCTERAELLQTRNFPLEDYAGMQDIYHEHDGRWQDEDKLVQADYDVYLGDEKYIQYLQEGMSWGTALRTGADDAWNDEGLPVVDLGMLETFPGRDVLNELVAALEKDPADAGAWDRLSGEYTKAGRRDLALKCYEVLTAMYSGNGRVWYNKGVLQRDSGQMQAAEESFKRAIGLDPDLGQAWSELGKMHFRRNEIEKGMACYGKAIELDPSYTISYVNLGYYLIKFGRYEEAVYYSGRGMEEGDEYGCPFNKAHAHLLMGERDKALELYVYTLTGGRATELFISDFHADAALFAGTSLHAEYEALLPRILQRARELRGTE